MNCRYACVGDVGDEIVGAVLMSPVTIVSKSGYNVFVSVQMAIHSTGDNLKVKVQTFHKKEMHQRKVGLKNL